MSLSLSALLVPGFSAPNAADEIKISIDASKVLHAANPMYMGCHSDSGFVHQVTGWSSQMVFGESFERPPAATKPGQSSYAWQAVVDAAVAGGATVALDPTKNFSGWPSMAISLSGAANAAGAGAAGVANRGLGNEGLYLALSGAANAAGAGAAGVANRGLGNEGLYLVAGKEYEGYFFAKSEQPVTLEVRLMGGDNYTETLAAQQLKHEPGAAGESKANPGWVRHTFTLTPSKGAECVGIAPGSDPAVHCTAESATHPCIRCGGQLFVGVAAGSSASAASSASSASLTSAASTTSAASAASTTSAASAASATGAAAANVAFVVLQPGEWGRFNGLNARRDVAETLTRMGVKAIRLGGSFCSVTKDNGVYYQWQRWTGAVWDRPSVGASWSSYGHDAYNLIGGWGPFEMIDYAAALGAEPIITTTMTSTPDELAGLVEYCWGNASTPLGARRIADGHPEPYRLRYVELGNEEYNGDYLAQVEAMEASAARVGAAGQLRYMFPDNPGVTGDDVARAARLGLGARLVTDVHVGAGGGLKAANATLAAHAAGGLRDDAAVNFETNAGTHHHGRALDEAADLGAFFNAGDPRMLARTASFCHGRAGHFDMFDQAISFFLPNMSWLQPPGHVHAMVTASWQPRVIASRIAPPDTPPPGWRTFVNRSLTCSSDEYRGTAQMANDSAAGCLAAARAMEAGGEGIDYAVYPGNRNCYVCSLDTDVASIESRLSPHAGAASFATTRDVVEPPSVVAAISDDGATAVARIVHHGSAPATAALSLDGFVAASATAVTLASDDREADNTAADVARVAPRPLAAADCTVGASGASVRVVLPALSFTVVTMVRAAAE